MIHVDHAILLCNQSIPILVPLNLRSQAFAVVVLRKVGRVGHDNVSTIHQVQLCQHVSSHQLHMVMADAIPGCISAGELDALVLDVYQRPFDPQLFGQGEAQRATPAAVLHKLQVPNLLGAVSVPDSGNQYFDHVLTLESGDEHRPDELEFQLPEWPASTQVLHRVVDRPQLSEHAKLI